MVLKKRNKFVKSTFVVGLILHSQNILAYQDAAVLPAGVRQAAITNVNTTMDTKSDHRGKKIDLASPLQQTLKFDRVVAKSTGFDQLQLTSLLTSVGLSPDSSAGDFTADLKAQVNVVAPTFAWGITDKLTLGFGVPVYAAKSSARLGFQPNDNARAAVQALVEQGQVGKAREAAMQLNGAADSLQATLAANGYQEVGDWSGTGLGDIEVQAKYLHYQDRLFRVASLSGVVMPTGRVADPDILTDVPFGDGNWDIFTGVNVDQVVSSDVLFNQYLRYTHQLPDRKTVRLGTEEEAIAVEKQNVAFKLGDKIGAGASAQLSLLNGFTSLVGYNYESKYSDRYSAGASSAWLARDSDQVKHIAEGSVGYSTLRQFQREQAAVPFTTSLSYLHQFASRNAPIQDLMKVDVKVYF